MVKMAVHVMVVAQAVLLLHTGIVTLAYTRSDVVRTTLGPIRGLTKVVGGRTVEVFWGIPFAKPPTGLRRFKHPEPPEPWNEVRDTVTKPNSCFQVIDTAFDQFEGVQMWNPNTNMSEDCLYLNVWVPKGFSSSPRATMVWIFGGGFWAGTSTLDIYDGSKLAATENVIVVSLNYRVGSLGFLYTGNDDAPGNQGLMDQTMALKWVHDNVGFFGGSKDTVSIFGESAGAVSVGFHLLSPLSSGLFARAIMQSGSPLCSWAVQSRSQAILRGEKLGEILGCSTRDSRTMVECLKNRDAQNITDLMFNLTEHYFDVPLGPVVDNYFLPGHPKDLMANGQIKNTEVLIGVNKDEGLYWLLYGQKPYFPLSNDGAMTVAEFRDVVNALNFRGDNKTDSAIIYEYYDNVLPSQRESLRDIADDISGDDLFKCAVVDFANEYAKNHDVYLYSFEHQLSNLAWPKWTGVMHGYEIEAIFGLPQEYNYTREDESVASRMMAYWTRFSQLGDPNNDMITWPKMTPQGLEYLRIAGEGDTVKKGLRHQQCSFRRVVLPLLQQDKTSELMCHTAGQDHVSSSLLLITMYCISLALRLRM
ncbi:cholinesterase 2-like isoform X2 [Pomacea canaliculata]|uniref:cholinesterase 2-like isoform X2 n=1 Tax=Pomacea canaliculata TaxID=400727 RepID=UPI000D73ECF1|nr:cholinesterase 2-like isoform X2 [Pomacea canaliculata]